MGAVKLTSQNIHARALPTGVTILFSGGETWTFGGGGGGGGGKHTLISPPSDKTLM